MAVTRSTQTHSHIAPQVLAKKGKSKPKKSKGKKAEAKAPVDTAEISKPESSKSKSAEATKEAAKPNPAEGAEEIPGMFKILKKDGNTWFSIKPEQFNKPFFFSANVSKSIGEKRLVGSEMGDSYLAEFRKVDDKVQLVALHTENFAQPNTPQAQFVEEGYADSLISSAPTMEAGDTGEFLVPADVLLFKDIPNYQARLKYAYKTPFALDTANTHFTQIDNSDIQTSFGVEAHYQGPSLPPGDLPSTTPVANSVMPEFRYNFLKLPDEPMKPRMADERIGHFVTTRKDYTGDEGDGIVRYVNRWRLEKKDPDAKLSEPVKPITYWVAKDVPENYREAVKEGILEWNKAFEAIGYKNAIQVQQQTDKDQFDTLDARHASVRWYTAADVGSAVGPSHVDPRSGEILDADIRMADIFGRSARRFLVDNPAEENELGHNHEEHGHIHGHSHGHGHHACEYQAHAGAEQMFANSLLEARGDVEATEELAQAYVKDVVMHEVGHTLGLRHNFRGSTVHTPEQLQDAEFTKQNGLGSSVMDYHPFNLAGPGEKQGEYVMSTLGAYDYLAVKYAYEQLPENKEAETLNEIARQTTVDPKLSYETDEAADDMDPTVTRFDLGSDPLVFAEKQMSLAHELWDRAQNRELPKDASYKELTRAFSSGLNKVAQASRLMTRYIGGMTIRRDRAGTENAVYEPVPADKQREALQQLTENVFSAGNFKFKPEFVSRLARERFDNWGNQNIHVGKMVNRVQSRVLQGLMLDYDIAQRLIDNPEKLPEDAPKIRLSEVYQTVKSAVWSELSSKNEISHDRRELQREYIKVASEIISEDSKAPGEARSIMRYISGKLKAEIDASLKGEMSLEQRAHLEDCSHQIDEALNPRKR